MQCFIATNFSPKIGMEFQTENDSIGINLSGISSWWRNKYVNCCSIMYQQRSEYGICYSFNSAVNFIGKLRIVIFYKKVHFNWADCDIVSSNLNRISPGELLIMEIGVVYGWTSIQAHQHFKAKWMGFLYVRITI